MKARCLSGDNPLFTKGEIYPVEALCSTTAMLLSDANTVAQVPYSELNDPKAWELSSDEEKAPAKSAAVKAKETDKVVVKEADKVKEDEKPKTPDK